MTTLCAQETFIEANSSKALDFIHCLQSTLDIGGKRTLQSFNKVFDHVNVEKQTICSIFLFIFFNNEDLEEKNC